jgi:ribosomal protein S18 acetylase RimI-like enzyme
MVARQAAAGGSRRGCLPFSWENPRVAAPAVEIRRLDPGEIEIVRPLWEALLAHHGRVAPQLPAIRGPQDSWRRRRAEYDDWLSRRGSFALVAEAGDDPVGYVLVLIEPGDDTWSTDERIAMIQTLSVDPGWRGRGIGTQLMDAADAELERIGVRDVFVGAVSTNEGALRFYERRGLSVSLVHFYGRRGG